MKKTIFIMVAMLLLLTGCVQNEPLLTEAFKKEYTSFEAKGTLMFDTNLSVDDEQIKSLLQVLKSGLNANTQVRDKQNVHQTIALQDPSPIMGTEIWPSKTTPALDIYFKENELYLKTTADNKFLGIKDDQSLIAQEEFNTLLNKLTENFLKQNTFTLKHVETVGEDTIQLPDGSKQKATHLRITLDFQEMKDLLTYVVEYLSESAEFEQMMKDILPAEVQADDMQSANFKDGLKDMVKELKAVNVEELKKQGWNANIVLNNWINEEKYIVQTNAQYTVHVPSSLLSEVGVAPTNSEKSIYFTLKVHEQYWNHNKEVTYPVPQADQIIMLDRLEKEPELIESFGKESLIGQFASVMFPKAEPPFADVPDNHWAYEPITSLKDMGIVSGYGNNEFKPNQSITRSEFVVMAVKSLGFEPTQTKLTFKDKNQIPTWANEYWQTAVQSGLIKGYDDGKLRPNQKISRVEMISILVRGSEMPLQNNYQLRYLDTKDIPKWAVPYVKTATANGLVKGSLDNRFAPHKNASRSEVAKVLYNVMFGVTE